MPARAFVLAILAIAACAAHADPSGSTLSAQASPPEPIVLYATGGHDFGVRQNDKLPSTWTGLALRWLRSWKLLDGAPAPTR